MSDDDEDDQHVHSEVSDGVQRYDDSASDVQMDEDPSESDQSGIIR